jgi:hypothetical protein
MKIPRFKLAGLMILVAALALNLGIIRTIHDGAWGEHLSPAVKLTLPTLNVIAAVGIVGLRRRSAFALGFVTVGLLSLVGSLVWIDNHPWTFLRYVEPLCKAIDRKLLLIIPAAHEPALQVVLAVGFLVPHTTAGVLGGWLTAKGWSVIGSVHRKSLPQT